MSICNDVFDRGRLSHAIYGIIVVVRLTVAGRLATNQMKLPGPKNCSKRKSTSV